MYKLLFREVGSENWTEGPAFKDKDLTPDAQEVLVERYARHGLETKLVRMREGDER